MGNSSIEQEIIWLRREGKRNKEIAQRLRVPLSQIHRLVSKLIAEGKLEDRRKLSFSATWRDVDSDRVKTIIELRKQHMSFQAIGQELGLTRERVRQLNRKIIQAHGNGVFESNKCFWTIPEAANELDVPQSAIRYLCMLGRIPHQRVDTQRKYIIPEEGMSRLRQHFSYRELPSQRRRSGRYSSQSWFVGPGTEFREISNQQWDMIQEQLPPSKAAGRPRVDDRKVLNGILYVLTTGCRWRDLPKEFGSSKTAWRRRRELQELGVWGKVLKVLTCSD